MPASDMEEECVETEDLVAMLEGNLASDRVEAVLVHVDKCKLCAEVIANVARDTASRGVGRYQLGRVIGAGGMSVVHEGWDPELRRRVAVKLVRPERSDVASHARMLREARALARISHPNVVAVYDVGEHAGEIYVATELVDGETMATWCDGRSSREIVGAWIQAARGLHGAHAGGIVHRDVKPTNVLVGRDGRVRIGDFGLARLGPIEAVPPTQLDPSAPPGTWSEPAFGPAPSSGSISLRAPTDRAFATVTDAGQIAGTPAYMAPEQWRGVNDARSDQYALSVAVVESLTGARPGEGGAFALPAGTAGGEALARALARGLSEDPEARFPSTEALADAMAAAIAPPVRRSRVVAIVAIAAVVAVGAGSAVAWSVARRGGPACDVAVIPEDVWSPARRAGLEKRFPPAIAAHVDAWMAAWSAAAADTCAVDADPPVVRERRRRCLDGALDEARKTLARWDAKPYQSIMAQIAIELLPRPAGCSRAAALAEVEPVPAQALAISALRDRMDHAIYVVKHDELAVTRDVAGAARELGHAPFIVETAIEHAKQLARYDRNAGAAVMRDAIARADQVHDDRSRAQATIALIGMLDADRADEAVTVVEPARAGLARIGGDPALECDLDRALGSVLKSAQRYDEAIAALERARRNARDAYGPDSNHEALALNALEGAFTGRQAGAPGARPVREAVAAIYRTLGAEIPGVESGTSTLQSMTKALEDGLALQQRLQPRSENEADARWALGAAYFLAGDLARALEQRRGAAAIYDRLNVRKSAAVDVHTHIALALCDAGDLHEALREANRAVAIANAIAVKDDLGFALNAQGQIRLALGDLAGARAVLKRALAIRMEIRAGPTQLGTTQFHYARALWKVDRRLAVDFATSARVLIRSYLDAEITELDRPHILPLQHKRLADINRWLDEHEL